MVKKNIKKPQAIKNSLTLLFDPEKEKPKPCLDANLFSVDVFIIDEDGINGIAFYNFDTKDWGYHSDTLGKYDEGSVKWFWYYPPINENDINSNAIKKSASLT